jgi:hypothetical protein
MRTVFQREFCHLAVGSTGSGLNMQKKCCSVRLQRSVGSPDKPSLAKSALWSSLGLEQAAQLNLNGSAPGLMRWWRLGEADTHVNCYLSESQARVLA